MPTAIWEQFGEVSGKNTITFGDIGVRLIAKNPGVLTDQEIHFKFPKGGGEIDLSKFVDSDRSGTIYVFFDLPEVDNTDQMKAFYISQARKRKIDDEVWGSGCNKYMDIKKFILGEGKKRGLEVNTTRDRHLTVLGGTFFFAIGNSISQITFTDSVQTELFCKSEKNNDK